jgi:hypothetical protein
MPSGPWWRRQQGPLKRLSVPGRLHGAISQKYLKGWMSILSVSDLQHDFPHVTCSWSQAWSARNDHDSKWNVGWVVKIGHILVRAILDLFSDTLFRSKTVGWLYRMSGKGCGRKWLCYILSNSTVSQEGPWKNINHGNRSQLPVQDLNTRSPVNYLEALHFRVLLSSFTISTKYINFVSTLPIWLSW